MGKGREIRCYDYVNHPYEQVRDVLSKDPLRVFQSATSAAASRARSIASELRIEAGGIAVQADIDISIKKIDEKTSKATGGPVTRLQLEWQAAKIPSMFPIMKAELLVYPLTRTETQLDFSGFYEPPLGALGKTVNAIIGHRIAEGSVHRFVSDVAASLSQNLA
jgi:hypothetical protein